MVLLASTVMITGTLFPAGFHAQEAPTDPILLKAFTLYNTGDGKTAKAIYEAYMKEYPKSPEAAVGLARIAEREFNFPLARNYLEEALSKSPGRADIVAELAHLYHQWSVGPFASEEDYHARAEEYFRQAQMIQANNLVYLTYLGEWQLDQGNTVSADRNFQKALKEDVTYVPAFQGMARLYMKINDLNRAKEVVLHAFELNPDNTTSYYQMAQLLALANHPEQSIKYALKSQQLDFGIMPDRDLLLARQYERLGDLKKALAYYEIIDGYAPNQPTILVRIAELSEMLGQEEKSMAYFEKALQRDPSLLSNWLSTAQDNLRQEKTVDAIRRFRRVLVLKPGQEQALHGLASAHFTNYFYGQPKADSIQADMARFTQLPTTTTSSDLLAMDLIKLGIALENLPNHQLSTTSQQRLETIAKNGSDDLAVGEALYLLGQYLPAQQKLDAVDGQTAEGYLQAADRLMLDGEFIVSSALYQRGYQLEPLPDIKTGMQRIESKQKLASQRVQEGNLLFDAKKFEDAAEKYSQASLIYREWDTAYLRLGDAYEKLHNKELAGEAFRQAVALNPALLDSKWFAKKFKQYKNPPKQKK